jgi:diphthamide synthase (EF-2-diphthine--ammonia ligase)
MSNDSEYEKLKTFCDQNGFDVINESGEFSNFFLVVNKKKDIWEGVEFCKNKRFGSIYLVADVKEIDLNQRYIPSTEEDYVNQLKAKAFELYREINVGDIFSIGTVSMDIRGIPNFVYNKKLDSLFYGAVVLYENGKWAKKLPKRIEVSILNIIIEDNYHAFEKCKSIGKEAIFDYMSKQLEKLLNDEVD